MTETVGVIGLGIMGGAFARHLAAAGVHTVGFDLLPGKMDAFRGHGGHSRLSARAVAAEAGVVITSLPHAGALEEVLFGAEGLVTAGRSGLLLVETSTFSLEVKEYARARLASTGAAMLDAPVSGTGGQAQVKDISIFVSGERSDSERVHGILSHLARSVKYVGTFGVGSKVKYIANLLVAIHTLAAAEAITLGEKAGLDPSVLVELLSDSAATSRMLEVRGQSMAGSTYAEPMMKVEVFQKDLDIVADFARKCECAVPLFNTSSPFFRTLAAQGMGGCDTASVIAVLRQGTGLSAQERSVSGDALGPTATVE